jgi:hypothetical protein
MLDPESCLANSDGPIPKGLIKSVRFRARGSRQTFLDFFGNNFWNLLSKRVYE